VLLFLQMEAAFCAYLGRASSVSAQLVRWLQLAAWLVALLKWLYRSATGHPLASQTPLEWAAGGSLVFLVVVAGGASGSGWWCHAQAPP
jgi:hypothetical protein